MPKKKSISEAASVVKIHDTGQTFSTNYNSLDTLKMDLNVNRLLANLEHLTLCLYLPSSVYLNMLSFISIYFIVFYF